MVQFSKENWMLSVDATKHLLWVCFLFHHAGLIEEPEFSQWQAGGQSRLLQYTFGIGWLLTLLVCSPSKRHPPVGCSPVIMRNHTDKCRMSCMSCVDDPFWIQRLLADLFGAREAHPASFSKAAGRVRVKVEGRRNSFDYESMSLLQKHQTPLKTTS